MTEAAYNRRAFHDEGLPDWFMQDERRHMRANKPVTAQEVREAKAALRALNERPIKKVAEARARKRKRVEVKMEAARGKANAIADQEDVPMNSRMREIERIYAKARKQVRGKVVGKGTDPSKRKSPKAVAAMGLDRRMKGDKRTVGTKAKEAKSKKKKQRKGGGGKGDGKKPKTGRGPRS